MPLDDYYSLSFIIIGILLGGIVKGATGAGMPLIAIPVIAAFYDAKLAVILLVVPNLFSNLWQMYNYKQHNEHPSFTKTLAIAGVIGAGLGTVILAYLPVSLLSLLISILVFTYIALRLMRPDFSLSMEIANKWVFSSGFSGGILQGALGLSFPIVITFLNSIKLPRNIFVFTTSVFFASMSAIQIPMQFLLGLLTWQLAAISLLGIIPLIIGMQVGENIGKNLNQKRFDQTILIILALLGTKMFMDSIKLLTN